MLADISIRRAKPKAKPFKLFDGGGLYLEVFPNGSKLWRLKYRRADGKETRVSLGAYPEVPAPAARAERDAIKLRRKQEGIDPAAERRMERLRGRQAAAETFEGLAREWLGKQNKKWSQSNADKVTDWLEKDIFPWLGTRPIKDISSLELLAVLRRIETRGALEKARRTLQVCSHVFKYGVQTGRALHNPAPDLRGALAAPKTKHHASIIEPKAVGELLRAINGYEGTDVARCALRLAPLVFVRPGELRHAEWKEINLDAAEWRIPAEKMKMGVAHLVPLSSQAVAVLKDIQPRTGSGRYVFPSERSRERPMSENTVNAALRRMGYSKEQMTGHGFRAMARTLLAELGWKPDAIERQLAHKASGPLGAAYDRAQFLNERRKMMQAWADFLDRLAGEGNVVLGQFGRPAAAG